MASNFLPFFLPSSHGALYGLYLPHTSTEVRGTLLWLPPFAEEANCARRHIVAAARECQAQGYASLLIDPFGTGESDGELVDASWDIWRSNIVEAASWLRAKQPGPLWLAGVRAGVLLAADVVSDVMPAGMVCWQPVSSGRAVLDSFLRMKLASEWALGEATKAMDILGKLREQLAAGASVEVAGYELSASMAAALAARTLSWAQQACERVACVEFRTHGETPSALQHTPAMARLCDGLSAAGMRVASLVCEAPAFWQAHEAVLTPRLGVKTATLLKGLRGVSA
ncbi:MAG: esterase/lipase/thioesterase family active site [Rhodocyclales bacterium]|nr:esterase/lipase/thioesterase family active site [Rhodocyclales bacterium]